MEQLKVDGALEAVKKPALNARHPFTDGVAEKLVDDLRRVRVAQGEQALEAAVLGQYIEPVQLQVVCRRLWENLPDRQVGQTITAEDVEQFGNVDRALTDFYESTLHQVLEQAKPLDKEQGWNVREGRCAAGWQGSSRRCRPAAGQCGSDTTGDHPTRWSI
jgi:hypothetical protein